MAFLDKLAGVLTYAMALIGGLAVALMMAHVSLDVFFRYVLNRPLTGALTMVTYYYMVIAAFIPLGFVQQRRAHISVEVFTTMMPRRLQSVLAVLTNLLTLIVVSLLAWRGSEAALRAMSKKISKVQGDTDIAVWLAYFAIPIGAGLMALVLFWQVCSAFMRREAQP